jgi:two-component system chemotaxis response regulator CheY
MKVLSVDDSSLIRRVVRGAVEVLGYELVEACDGVAALELLEVQYKEIVLALLDWNMPRMDGFTLLTKMKEDERFKHIPIAMVTTEVERLKVIRAIKAGAINYVMKPFSQEELSKKILECLGQGV